jgi:hypothetical protein
MASRNELVARGNAVGLTASNYPNDSKFEQKILYLEKFGTTYTETLGTCVFTTAGADVAAGDTITIGNTTYTFRATALTGVKATSTLTNATSFSDGETLTIDGRVYVMKTTITNTTDEIAIGANVAISLDNIKQAINQGDTAWPTAPTNEGRGTNYSTSVVRHPTVTATTNGATTQVIAANEYGTRPNSFLTSETAATGSWTGTALSGGVATVANEILIQASAAATLDVLKDAINATTTVAVAGTDYSDGTKAHTQVTATTNTNTAQTVASRNAAFDNASIATVMTGGGNMAAGGATLASGVRGVIALSAAMSAGISGDKNHV